MQNDTNQAVQLQASNQNSNVEPMVEQINGKNVFVWNSFMTGSQSKVAVLENFAKLNPGSKVIVFFTSQGGGVDDCRASYNRMLMLRTFYNMHFTFIVLEAKSCALWFIQCADVRIALPYSSLMYHGVKWELAGAKDEREFRECADAIKRNQQEFTAILCSRAADSAKVIEETLKLVDDGKDHIITAQYALDAGWIDQIYQPKFAKVEGEVDLAGVMIPSQTN